MTLAELQLAAKDLVSGDIILQIQACPAFWLFAVAAMLGLVAGRFVKLPAKAMNALAVAVLAALVVAVPLVFKPSANWLAKNGDLAKKSAEFVAWKRTDASTFTRFEVLKLKRVMVQDLEVVDSVMADIIKKGGTAESAEHSVMFAMDLLHHPNGGAKRPLVPAKK